MPQLGGFVKAVVDNDVVHTKTPEGLDQQIVGKVGAGPATELVEGMQENVVVKQGTGEIHRLRRNELAVFHGRGDVMHPQIVQGGCILGR